MRDDVLSKAIKEIVRISKRYILVMEYPLALKEDDYPAIVRKDIELLFRYKGDEMFWYREYSHRFPSTCKQISNGELGPDVGFDEAYHWWLFEK